VQIEKRQAKLLLRKTKPCKKSFNKGNPVVPSVWQKKRFVTQLQAGGLVAYPTEAVFGLGCDPLNEGAVYRLLDLKGRSVSKGLILIASDFCQLEPYVQPLSDDLMSKIKGQVSEPTTWLLPAKTSVPAWLTGGRSNIAVRLTQHGLAKELCQLAGTAIVSTSANMSGCEAVRTAYQARLKFLSKNVYTISGQVGGFLNPSRIIDPFLNKQLR
jgi:L-threonylcarbamoyladenylate synthase